VYFRLTRTYGNIWARTRETDSRATKEEEEEESQLCPTTTTPPNTTTTTTTTTTAATKTPSTRTHSIKISLGHISTQKQHDSPTTTITTVSTNDSRSRIRSNRAKELRRFLLLNGYPILWILLWIPGMANRAYELAGRSPTWLQVLQATTQLVGLANVLTYAVTEKFVERLGKRFGRTEGFNRT
jgi:hypothetical protein